MMSEDIDSLNINSQSCLLSKVSPTILSAQKNMSP